MTVTVRRLSRVRSRALRRSLRQSRRRTRREDECRRRTMFDRIFDRENKSRQYTGRQDCSGTQSLRASQRAIRETCGRMRRRRLAIVCRAAAVANDESIALRCHRHAGRQHAQQQHLQRQRVGCGHGDASPRGSDDIWQAMNHAVSGVTWRVRDGKEPVPPGFSV